MEVRILDAIAEASEFKYHYVTPEDGQWGRKLKNGKWTGMIGCYKLEPTYMHTRMHIHKYVYTCCIN